MSSQDFADPALKEARERQLALSIKDAAKVRTPEELEKEANENKALKANALSSGQNASSSLSNIAGNGESGPSSLSNPIGRISSREIDSAGQLQRNLSITSEDSPSVKRTGSTDSPSARLNASKSVSSNAIDVLSLIKSSTSSVKNEKRTYSSMNDIYDEEESRPLSPETSLSSNRISLDDFSSKKSSKQQQQLPTTSNSYLSSSTIAKSIDAPHNSPIRLINSTGKNDFEIRKPFAISFKASVQDRRVQGLLPSSLNIDGRVKIDEMEKFIIEVSNYGKKIIACCRIFIDNDPATEIGYRKFCDEYSDAKRAGISNLGKGDVKNLQFYIVPPKLKDSISILRDLEGGNISCSLYGVIVSKDSGPSEYVNAKSEIMDNTVPLSPSHSTHSRASGESQSRMNYGQPNWSNGLTANASESDIMGGGGLYDSADLSRTYSPDDSNNFKQLKSGHNINSAYPGQPQPQQMPLYSNSNPLGRVPPAPAPFQTQPSEVFPSRNPSIPAPGIPNSRPGVSLPVAPLPPRGLGMGNQQLHHQLQYGSSMGIKPTGLTMPPNPMLPRGMPARPMPPGGGNGINVGLPAASATTNTNVSGSGEGVKRRSRWEPASSTPIVPNIPGALNASGTAFYQLNRTDQEMLIQNKAEFCAANGVKAIDLLRNLPNAAQDIPFVFEGHPSFDYFLTIIKNITLGPK